MMTIHLEIMNANNISLKMMIPRSLLCVCLFVTKTATAVTNTLTHQQGAKRDGSRDDNDGDDDDEDGDDDDDENYDMDINVMQRWR